LKRVCAWCRNEIPEPQPPGGPPSGDADEEGPVSHGICLACADKLFADQAVSLQSIIDRLPIPVLVVDSDVTVSLLNKQAQAVLGATPEQAVDRKGGELFDCVYSHLPDGCGRTIHCSGCALRRAVTTTYETGEPQVFIPASLKRNDPDDPSSVSLRVTTIKRDNLVMVKLDNAE
jgi:hypothetical protein